MRYINRAVVVGVTVITITAVAMLGEGVLVHAGQRRKTYAPQDCNYPRVRPNRIIFACADANAYINSLRWPHWAGRKAGGHGVLHLNDCDPSCAEGQFHDYRAKIRLGKARRSRCNNHVVRLFHIAHLRFPHSRPPDAGRWRRARMICFNF